MHAKTMNHEYQDPTLAVKAVNWLAAVAGIGTWLGFVNIVVGILSAGWLSIQLYGYIRYELPHKKAKLQAAQRELALMIHEQNTNRST